MTWLAAALEATALATLRRIESRAIAGGWLGGVTGAAADPIPRLSQFRRQRGEQGMQISVFLTDRLDLLLLREDESSGTSWLGQPVRFYYPCLCCAHHRWSLPEMEA